MAVAKNPSLEILRTFPGRALCVQADGTMYLGREHGVYSSIDDGVTWRRVLTFPRSAIRGLAEFSRLACRLLRHEIRALARLSDGCYVGATRQGVFYAPPSETQMRPSRVRDRGLPVHPPMSLTVGPDGRVLWGEYWVNRERRPVRLYASEDRGVSYDVVHTFAAGEVKHIHNLVYDERYKHYWVLAGDHGTEPGIGRLSADLKTFDWLVKGKQEYRAVCLFDMGEYLVYGTDSEMASNAAMRLEKTTGKTERLAEFDGSCIHGCKFGSYLALSTSVEPSAVNRSQRAGLWLSRDGERWTCVYRAAKDRWNATYFQFGSIVLPRGESGRETALFSGQALVGIDGRAAVAALSDTGLCPDGPRP
ncbi:MAG TPA: hypothetical protein VMV94_09320 [Phycisphaerae bacterium]|nr:hypothetical protein [Phycisphaerae bacterium]